MKDKKDKVLMNWMKEFFPYGQFRQAGIFTKEMRGDYKAQAEHICKMLCLKSIYEYGKDEIKCHITYANPDCPAGICTNGRPLLVDKNGRLKPEPFITIIPSIWDDNFIHLADRPFIDGSKYDEDDDYGQDDGSAPNPVIIKPPKIKKP